MTEYSDIKPFSNGFAAVCDGKKWGYINKQGKVVISLKYEGADEFEKGSGAVFRNRKFGLINRQGKLVVPIKYYDSPNLSSYKGLYNISGKDGVGVIDSNGKIIVPAAKYDYIMFFREGLALVGKKIGGEFKGGFINKKGKLVIPIKYGILEQ